jgi:hypothetical protein
MPFRIYILHQNISKQGFEVFEANHDTMIFLGNTLWDVRPTNNIGK